MGLSERGIAALLKVVAIVQVLEVNVTPPLALFGMAERVLSKFAVESPRPEISNGACSLSWMLHTRMFRPQSDSAHKDALPNTLLCARGNSDMPEKHIDVAFRAEAVAAPLNS